MLTDAEIDRGKKEAPRYADKLHEHNDCVRIAYEWLDAQMKTKGATKKIRAVKHIIESWGGRYVSTDDVQVAAWLHPEIRGTYPYYNISARLTRPSTKRLMTISEADKHTHYRDRYQDCYAVEES